MIVVQHHSLTQANGAAILSPAGNKSAGFRSLKSKGVNTPSDGVFLCLKKIVTVKIRAFVMVARNGQMKIWPEPLPGTANPLRVAAQQFAVVGGGFQSSVKDIPHDH